MPPKKKKKEEEVKKEVKPTRVVNGERREITPKTTVTSRRKLTEQDIKGFRVDPKGQSKQEFDVSQAALKGKREQFQEEREQETQLQEEVAPELEEKGVFAEQPQRRELSPELEPQERIPVLGTAATVLRNLLIEDFQESEQSIISNVDEVGNEIIDPDVLRLRARVAIEREVNKQGLSNDLKFGAVIESIPVVGGLARKFGGSLIATPSSRADDIIRELNNEKERAINIAEMDLNPSLKLDRLTPIESNINRLESRLRLLIINSAELRSNPDEVNRIESEVIRAKERIVDARNEAGQQLVRRVIIPDDPNNLLLTLDKLKENRKV